jgi:hypothetical protein
MRYKILRPSVPVAWLDTHAITKIAYAVKFPDDHNEENTYIRELYVKLQTLVAQKKIIIFEADQMFEIGVRPELVEDSARVLSTLSRGLITSKDVVEENQHNLAMKAYINDEDEVEIPWETAFVGNPLEDRTIDGMVVRVDILTPEMIQKQKALNESIAEELESLRAGYVQEAVRESVRRERQTEAEFGAYPNIYRRILNSYVERGRVSEIEDEFWLEYNIVLRPYSNWKNLNGEPNPRKLIEMYESDYYKSLPHVDIWSRLTGQKMVIGSQIKRGDVADMHNIEYFMPYTNIMVIDRAMRGLVKDLRLHIKYDVNVASLNELSSLLPEVD